ncbi:MAG: phospholipase [Actinomycetota bacterium]|nr:phospholipase [Actinomycetota bacterium]
MSSASTDDHIGFAYFTAAMSIEHHDSKYVMGWWRALAIWWKVILLALFVIVFLALALAIRVFTTVSDPSALLKEDRLVSADVWDPEPRMLAAGLGFTGIIGIPGLDVEESESSSTRVRLAGGTWNVVKCRDATQTDVSTYTSAATPEAVETTYGRQVFYSDGLPIEFSWPALPSTVGASDFLITLNNGTTTVPEVAAVWPNFEYNERSTIVLFGHFGNRIDPTKAGALFPIRVDVVKSDTPLTLVGPGKQLISAAGMGVETGGSPYTDPNISPHERGGPRLAAAKLTRYSSRGDTGPAIFQPGLLPNHGEALYGDAAQYRLRVLTTGGMTPDGVRGMHPDEFERFFRLSATDEDGREITIDKQGTDYEINGGRLRVEGLADLGLKQDQYDDCYKEDRDNQIDIVISGDLDAVRAIKRVQMPSTGNYSPVYNPGGPGNNPAPGVRYAAPSPPIDIAVLDALDEPLVVDYP